MSLADEHEKLRQQVLQAMFSQANISISAPISPQLRSDYEIAADVLIRSTKRPLDPKKIQKHVEAIQKRHNARERDSALLPPIFVKQMNQNQTQNAASARNGKSSPRNKKNNQQQETEQEEDEHVGRAAHHFDRVEREALWANQIKKDSEDYVRTETERHAREEREKRVRLDALKQQVEEDHHKKEAERLEMRHYMDKKEAEGREIRRKEDEVDAQRRAKRAAERIKNDEYLQTVRERKNREQREQHEQERLFIEKLKEQEDLENLHDRQKRVQKVNDMRNFLKSNVDAEEERRNDMIRTRQEEIRLAPQQGIFFDGAYRRSARVNANTARQQQAYDQYEAHTGADMRRSEHTARLLNRMENGDGFLMEEQKKEINADARKEREERRRKQEELRLGLQQQITSSPRYNNHSGLLMDGAGKITVNKKNTSGKGAIAAGVRGKQNNNKRRSSTSSNSNLGGVIPGLSNPEVAEELRRQREAKMRKELKDQVMSQRKNRRTEVTAKI